MNVHVPGIVLTACVAEGEEVVPSRADAHRLRRVLRLPEGALVRGLSPDGSTAILRIAYRRGGDLRLVAIGRGESAASQATGLTVAVALIKRTAHLDFVIEKGTELGVDAWWAVATEHCADAGLLRSYGQRLARWRRIVEAAALQCGRAAVPVVRGVLSWDELVDAARAVPLRIAAVPGAATSILDIDPSWGPTLFFVGPEGGWSAHERDSLARAGFTAVSLGEPVLRSETAALVGAVVLALRTARRAS